MSNNKQKSLMIHNPFREDGISIFIWMLLIIVIPVSDLYSVQAMAAIQNTGFLVWWENEDLGDIHGKTGFITSI